MPRQSNQETRFKNETKEILSKEDLFMSHRAYELSMERD